MTNLKLKDFLPHIAAVVIFVLTSVMYFWPQFEGKVIPQSDILVFQGMSKEAKDYNDKTGEYTLWTNSMFGGMPTYQIMGLQPNNIFQKIDKVLHLGFERPTGFFIYAMISFYFLLLLMRVNPWLAIVGAIAFGFTANNLVLFEAGHVTKIKAIISSPIIIAGALLVFKKRYLIGALVFALGMGLNIFSNHYQMTYYLGIVVLILLLIELVKAIRAKEFPHIIKGGMALLVGLLIGVGSAAPGLLPTFEYSRDTMRGAPILETQGASNSSSETEGLDYNYAMQWSNGWLDLFASFIPGVVGGSSSEKITQDSEFAKEVRKIGSRADRAPLYWGKLPFTSGPIYFGAIICFLAVLSLFITRPLYKWWLLSATVLTLLLSLGTNFNTFNRFIFDFFPLYNKFRTPNSILSITAILLPLMAILAFSKIIGTNQKKELIKPLLISAGIFTALCLFIIFLGPSLFSMEAPGDVKYQSQGLDVSALISDRKSLLRSDGFRSLALCLILTGLIYAYIKDIIKSKYILISGLFLLTLFDVLGVGRRYVDHKDFVSPANVDQYFTPREVDKQILSDSDPHYRVFDSTIDVFNSSQSSYHHKTIGGNHAAKLQRYQDLIVRHISQNNQQVLNMLNTKYFVFNDQSTGQPQVQLNSAAAGNAWFVNNINVVPSANAEIDALNTFDPLGDAIVHQEFQNYVGGISPSKNGTINLTSYEPNKLSYTSNTNGDQFAVFSEIWYGPNKGWQAYIDGNPVDHIRVNYALRGLKVPSGQHEITFEFDPAIFNKAKIIALISSIVFVLLAGWVLYHIFVKRRNIATDESKEISLTNTAIQTDKVKATIAKTKKRTGKTKKKNKKKKPKKN